MLEDIRRKFAHGREAKEKEKLKRLEKTRRLSYIQMKRLEERKSVEEGLREQVGAELTAHKAARQALRERRQMERELRTARGPGVGMRIARGVGKVTKGVFYTLPVKSVRLGAKLSKGPALQKILVGDVGFVLGRPKPGQRPFTPRPPESLESFIFGSSAKTPLPGPKGKSPDILGIDKEILS